MSTIFSKVQVNITRETTGVPKAGFGVIGIAGPNTSSANRIDFYEDLASVASGLTNGTADPEYKAAEIAFSQTPRPAQVAIIRVAPGESYSDELTLAVQENPAFYAVDIVSRLKADQLDAAAWTLANLRVFGLASSDSYIISESVTQDTVNSVRLIFDSDILATYDTNITLNAQPMAEVPFVTDHNTTMDNIVTAIEAIDPAFTAEIDTEDVNYRTIIATYSTAPITVDGFICDDGGGGIIDTSTVGATIAAQLKAAANDRAFGFYHGSAATEYIEAGALAKLLTWVPGTYTAAYKTVAGATVDNLNTTQSGNVQDKYFNTYEELGGKNIIFPGKVSSGEFFDIVVFSDWLRSRLAESVYGLLANTKKVSFDDPGISGIESKMISVFESAITNGAVGENTFDSEGAQNGGYYIIMPLAANVSDNDKAARDLPGIKFRCWYTNAIHTVVIDGTIAI